MEKIELLVDGELTDSDRATLLAELDHIPDGWKRCALLYMEDQEIKRAVSSVQGASSFWEGHHPFEGFPPLVDTSDDDEVGVINEKNREIWNSTDIINNVTHPAPLEPESFKGLFLQTIRAIERISPMSQSALRFWSAIAGCLLIGFSIGFLLQPHHSGGTLPGSMIPSIAGNTVDSPRINIPPFTTQIAGFSATQSPAQLRLVSLEHDPHFNMILQLPCYENESFDPSVHYDTKKFRSNVGEWLRDSGHNVQIKRSYLVVGTPANECILVPVEDILIQYSSKNFYE